MCSFPLLSGLRLGSGDGNLMVVNDQAGYVLPLWAHSGGTYGNARYMSMQWGCVFDERSRDAFGFIVRDPDIRNKQIRYLEPSIEVSYFPPFSIPPGETVTFPEVEIMVYAGDWKRAAQRYRHWFSGNVGSVRHADWARRIDGHGAGWFEKRGQPQSRRLSARDVSARPVRGSPGAVPRGPGGLPGICLSLQQVAARGDHRQADAVDRRGQRDSGGPRRRPGPARRHPQDP